MTTSAERETRDLAQQLAEATATIDALLSGQIDAVVDPVTQAPVLLAKALEALRESEARYRNIVEATNEGVWLTDAEQKTTFMNRRMATMLGCEAETQRGRSALAFLDEEGRMKLAAQAQRPATHQVEVRFTRVDGTALWTLLGATPRFEHGVYAGFSALVMDITERKSAAQALAELSQRTERRERILTNTLSNISDFAYTYDRHGRFLFANQPLAVRTRSPAAASWPANRSECVCFAM
jgi:PAS domain S-box-containing protein